MKNYIEFLNAGGNDNRCPITITDSFWLGKLKELFAERDKWENEARKHRAEKAAATKRGEREPSTPVAKKKRARKKRVAARNAA